jgi:molecular chaperone DnaK
MSPDNRTLGKFHLVGIPPAPRGVPQVEVSFDIDANGIVNVSAKDMATGKQQAITITASSGLSNEEIGNMQKQAESHAEDDKRRRDEAEERNRTDNMVYNTEKILNENRDKIPEEEAKQIESAIGEAKKALAEADVQAVRNAREVLEKASHRLAEVMYQKATPNAEAGAAGGAPGPEGQESGGGGGDKDDGDVIDAEVVDDDKK